MRPTQDKNVGATIGYVRVSTEEQATEGVSLAAQEARIRAYCEMRGLTLVDVVVDAGVSAGKRLADRDGGRRILEALRAKQAKSVVALKLDRLFRNAGDCLTTVDAWDRTGISLHLVDMGGQAIDTSGAMGRFFLTLMAGVAELERNQIRERTSMAMRHMAARGEYCGGHAPTGFAVHDGTLADAPNEQAAIALARGLRGNGMSLRAVSVALTEAGHRNRHGRPYHPQQIARMAAS